VALARPAHAEGHKTSSLSWVELQGAESCGGAPAVARAVEARLGRHAIVSPVDAELSIEAYVERSGRPPLWHAVVQVRGRSGAVLGSRELASAADNCDELRASVAIVAALMIDPDAVRRSASDRVPEPLPAPEAPAAPTPPACPPPPEPPPPPAPRVIVERVEVPAPASPASQGWTVEPSASFALGFGVLPATAAGVRLGVGVGMPRPWAFEVFGAAWGNQSVGAEQGAQVRFALVDVGAAACPLTLGARRRVHLTACAGLEVGFVQTESQGFVAPENSLDPTLWLAVPSTLSFPLGQGVSIELGADLGVAVVGNQFFYRDPTSAARVVATQSLVTGEASLGLGVDLR
jgi:hypothetical protein